MTAQPNQFGYDLVHAILDRDEDKAHALLKRKANLAYTLKGDMPIHLATRFGLLTTIKNLLSAGDDVNRPNEHNNTPLHFAAKEGMEDIAEYLIASGADVNRQNLDGDNPLHLAVAKQSMDVIERFVSKGMNMNQQNNQGDTPLHQASAFGREESVEALLLSGADANIQNRKKKRAEDVAKSSSIKELIRGFKLLSPFMESGLIRSQGLKLGQKDVQNPRIIERLDLTIEEMDLPPDFPTTFYFRREFSENSTVVIRKNDEDEIVSDVYHIRVKDGYREFNTRITIPAYRAPSEKETMSVVFLQENGERNFVSYEREQNNRFYCHVDTVLVPETTCIFLLVVFPKTEEAIVGTDAQILTSEISPEFELNIPEESFAKDTVIRLKVFEPFSEYNTSDTNEEEESEDQVEIDGKVPVHSDESGIHTPEQVPTSSESIAGKSGNLLSDVYEVVILGDQPTKGITMQIPLKCFQGSDINALQVLRVNPDLLYTEPEGRIEPLSVEMRIDGGNVQFNVEHFSIYTLSRPMLSPEQLDEAYAEIMNSKFRSQNARFFVVARQADDDPWKYSIVLECGKAEGSKKRLSRWQEKGFTIQRPEHSQKVLLSASSEFRISVKGDLQFDADNGESGSRKLTFYTGRASYQPYQLCVKPDAKEGKAYVFIYDVNNTEGVAMCSEKSAVAMLNIELQLPPEDVRRKTPLSNVVPKDVPKKPQTEKEVRLFSKGEQYPSNILKK